MSKTDAMLFVKDKIRVSSIHPGYIQTACLGETPSKKTYEKLQPMVKLLFHASLNVKFDSNNVGNWK